MQQVIDSISYNTRNMFNTSAAEPAKEFWIFQLIAALLSSFAIIIELTHFTFVFLETISGTDIKADLHNTITDTSVIAVFIIVLILHIYLFISTYTSCVRRLKTCNKSPHIALLQFTILLGPVVYAFCITNNDGQVR